MSHHALLPDAVQRPFGNGEATADAATQPALTRRELRERERAAAARSAAVVSGRRAATPAAPEAFAPSPAIPESFAARTAVPAASADLTGPHQWPAQLRVPPMAPAQPERRRREEPRRRVIGNKALSLIAMSFAVSMAVATSVPANALLTSKDVAAQTHAARLAAPAAPGKVQSITSDGVRAQPVERDNYGVKSLEQVVALTHMNIADTFTNDPNGTIQWPFPVGVPISDWFGPRIAPTEGASTFHEGVDFDPGGGTPIQIMADGVVREVDPYDDNGCGVHVIIDHRIDGQLVSSEYCHMAIGSVRVHQGQHVKVAQIVGLVGDTGVSTGNHLHFQVMLNGTQPVDPYAWLKAHAN